MHIASASDRPQIAIDNMHYLEKQSFSCRGRRFAWTQPIDELLDETQLAEHLDDTNSLFNSHQSACMKHNSTQTFNP